MKSRPYHHGDLRRALIDAAIALVEETGPDGFTLREVARRARVSHTAPYRHFRDKNDLLLSQLEVFLETMSTMLSARKEASHRLVPVTEMFNHVGGQKKIYRALSDSGRLYDFFDLAKDILRAESSSALRKRTIPRTLRSVNGRSSPSG